MDNLIWAVLRFGVAFTIGGMCVLIVVIPWASRLRAALSVRTEFYSAKAAYWCVAAGLFMILMITLSIAVRFALASSTGGR